MKIIVDMNLPPQWVHIFQKAGYEALHWSTVGNPSADDFTIMNWAATNGYIVFTHNLEFGVLLVMDRANIPGVIQGNLQDVFSLKLADLVLGTLQQYPTELEKGALIAIKDGKVTVE